jgi:ketosteroid isomerase-like protein
MADRQTGSIKARTASNRINATVADFFQQFAHALTEGDARAIASMWETPAFVLGDQDARGVAANGEIERFFSGIKENYHAKGIMEARPEIVRLEWATDRIVIAEVRWPYIDGDGGEIGEESSTYVLRRDSAGNLKLRVAVMHGAMGAS